MNSIERFYATIERRPVDRPASWLGLPDPKAVPGLLSYFQVKSIDELRRAIDDDLYPIEFPYHSPTSEAIYAAFDFAKANVHPDERTLTTPGFFEDYSDPIDVDRFPWPNPEQYIDPEVCRRLVEEAPADKPKILMAWSAHFQDACAAFGMETALVKMLAEPEIFQAVIDRITDFYLRANQIFFEATRGKLDAVLIGNDFGSQTSLLISPDDLRTFVFDGTRRLVEQAKSYGLKVIHHSCGAIDEIIPDLIDCGIDAIHPIQALARNMDPEHLSQKYSERIAFCGGVDAQNLMINGSTDEIRTAVDRLIHLFPTGLILSPSHEAILQDTKPDNIEALFDQIHHHTHPYNPKPSHP